MKIAFLTCPGTHPGSDRRRADAYEHDTQMAALRPAFADAGMQLVEIDWRAPMAQFADMAAVLIGTPWDYHDDEPAFLAKLEQLDAADIRVMNSPDLVRWNARKTYLDTLHIRGAATIPTVWLDRADAADIASAMDRFGCDSVVAKRQVGAGAEGQTIHHRGAIEQGWQMGEPMMIQPFLDTIAKTGEISLLFIDGEFSHALVKRPAHGDYRVQSIYGGVEEAVIPAPQQIRAAQQVMDAIPFDTPLYARIDMVESDSGEMLVMEAEMIEPYLYPEQGPELGPRMARGVVRRLATAGA